MRFISAFIALLALATITGCASNTVARVTCSMPSAQTVDGYVAAATRNLSLIHAIQTSTRILKT